MKCQASSARQRGSALRLENLGSHSSQLHFASPLAKHFRHQAGPPKAEEKPADSSEADRSDGGSGVKFLGSTGAEFQALPLRSLRFVGV